MELSTSGENQIINYMTTASGGLKGTGTAVIFKDYVFAFLTMEGRSEQIKSEMIKTLNY